MRAQPVCRTEWTRVFAGQLVPLAAVILAIGCVRMPVLPTADPGIQHHLSEPRPQDHLIVPLEKDPAILYRVGARDVLRVDVRKDPSLNQPYTVTEEGHILLPNIGPVKVSGMTTLEIVVTLNEVLAEFIREPDVRVGVQDYRSKLVHVVGQVQDPGSQIMRADMLTLQDAIFAAGLPTANAAMHRTQVITPNKNNPDDPIVRQIDLTDILYKGKMSENIMLRPNDIVYVPASHATDISAVIRNLLGPIEDVVTLQHRATFGNDQR